MRQSRHEIIYFRALAICFVLSIIYYLLSVNCYLLTDIARAYVMGSPNYRIQSDSLNVGGLDTATSANYKIADTLGEIATGFATSTSYRLYAGYRQMQEIYLAISGGAPVTMTPAIGGVSGGTATGNTSFTIKTDNPAGYALSIRASTSPAMKSGENSFADYIPATAGVPDYNWSIDNTDSEFGFSPEGSDIIQKYKDNGSSACNTGSNNTSDKCWYGLSTSDEEIVSSSLANHPDGVQTTIKFKAESGVSHLQEEGDYGATIIVTAVSN